LAMRPCVSLSFAQHVEYRDDGAGELLAVGGQGECPVLCGVHERDAGDVFELVDLADQDGVLDAEVAGGVMEAGVPGKGEEPADALFGAWAGEGVPDRWREGARFAEAGERVGPAVDAAPDGDAGVAGNGGKGTDWDAGLSGDVLEAALPRLVLPAEPVQVDYPPGRGVGSGCESPALVRSCRMVRSRHPVRRAILRGPSPCLVSARSWLVPGGSGSGGGWAVLVARGRGAGWRATVSRICAEVVPSRAAMTWMGRPQGMSGCRSLGLM
jgi:hypothetical protein